MNRKEQQGNAKMVTRPCKSLGNEEADTLPSKRTSKPFTGLEIFCELGAYVGGPAKGGSRADNRRKRLRKLPRAMASKEYLSEFRRKNIQS